MVKKLKAFPERSRTRQGCPLSLLLFNKVLEVLVTTIREEKEIKRTPNWKEVKLSLFVDDVILYIENPENAARKLLEFINKSGEVAGYKINAQKCLAFLSTNNKRLETEIKETIPFTITMKRIKYLRIKLLKGAKDVYLENYKMLMKETKDDIYRW